MLFFARLRRARSPPSDIRSRQKTYLDIAGDEISRLRYVLNEKVKCKVPIWADEKLNFQKSQYFPKMLDFPKKVSKNFDWNFFIARTNIFRETFFSIFFCFRKLHVHSSLISYRTPSNSFWSLRTSFLHFGQKKHQSQSHFKKSLLYRLKKMLLGPATGIFC